MTRKIHVVITSDQPDEEENRRGYGELVQVLDDRSLSLILRDAKKAHMKDIEILRDH